MGEIDYQRVIRNSLEPRLGYHGFKYSEEKSCPHTGIYRFTRTYWGKPQMIIISRVQYTLEEIGYLTAEDDDIPTEVPPELISIKEPNFRLWLSNKYISAIVSHEYSSIEITRRGVGNYSDFRHLANMSYDEARPIMRELEKKHVWWEFHNEAKLRQVLHDILEIVLTEGLEWFERQVAEIRRYHEKLDARRIAEKERRQRKQLKKAQDTSKSKR